MEQRKLVPPKCILCPFFFNVDLSLVLLHPNVTEVYRSKVANLTETLNNPATKAEATTIIRSLLEEIQPTSHTNAMEIELVGELAGLIALCQTKTASERLLRAVLIDGCGSTQPTIPNHFYRPLIYTRITFVLHLSTLSRHLHRFQQTTPMSPKL
ncbi:hypothetical protein [Shimia sp. R9_1]|uniref:hypothetical protein n=1 Tax=Shimia sp. R9_1 TaxID=2821111 RepID=UPI001ADAFCD4|nr:hypothetical protein [Shimia sp. R9_1]